MRQSRSNHRGRVLGMWVGVVLGGLLLSAPSGAVPSMARQTGMVCAGCHTVFPELTPFGRQFKLRGFTMGRARADRPFPANLPLAGVVQLSRTTTARRPPPDSEVLADDRKSIVQTVGLYYGGRITDRIGALVQYNYDGFEDTLAAEMVDIRYANDANVAGRGLIYGFTLNNTPTLSDVYNSTPMWAFPHSETAGIMVPGTLLDMTLAAQVGGLGGYALWNDLLYVEFAVYRTAAADLLKPLHAGVPIEQRVVGTAPYWRVAIQQELGRHSLSLGSFGLVADIRPEGADGLAARDHYRDVAADFQYQFLGDRVTLSTTASWISERQRLRASSLLGTVDRERATRQSWRGNVHLSYRRTVAVGLGYFATSGPADMARFGTGMPVDGSAVGSADTRGWIAELAVLPRPPIKLVLRRTAFSRYNGARRDYDGFGRDAADNDAWYLLVWWAL